MNVTIWKYELRLMSEQSIMLPNHQFLSLQERNGKLTFWAIVFPDSRQYDYTFLIRGTGEPLEGTDLQNTDYLGTIQAPKGFVWHVFKKRRAFTDEEKKDQIVDAVKGLFPDKDPEEIKKDIESQMLQQLDKEKGGIVQ